VGKEIKEGGAILEGEAILVSHISSAILKFPFVLEHSELSDWLDCSRSKVNGEYPGNSKMADEM
jgi:hypothetical protein